MIPPDGPGLDGPPETLLPRFARPRIAVLVVGGRRPPRVFGGALVARVFEVAVGPVDFDKGGGTPLPVPLACGKFVAVRDGRRGPPNPFLETPPVIAGSLHGWSAASSSSSLSALRLSIFVLLLMTGFAPLVVMWLIADSPGSDEDEDAVISLSGDEFKRGSRDMLNLFYVCRGRL